MKKIKLAIRMLTFILLSAVFRLRSVNEKKVFFVTDVNDELTGNLKEVWNHIDKNEYLVKAFCMRKQNKDPGLSDIAAVAKGLCTSKYIFLEDVLDYLAFYRLRPGQEIVQLWHAAGAYKKFGFSRNDSGSRVHVSKGHKKYTIAITSSESIRKDYAQGYGISIDKVLATGVPRTDLFFDNDRIKKIKTEFYKEHPELENRKTILFAPTYRGNKISEADYDFSLIDPERLRQDLGEDYAVILKWHPALYNRMRRDGTKPFGLEFSSGKSAGDFYYDMSENREINKLMLVSDILVTDYSSVIFEWYLTGRPVIYFAYDMADYNTDRGLYYNFQEYVYGTVAADQAELTAAIKDGKMLEDKRGLFGEKFMSACTGYSAENVCRTVFGYPTGLEKEIHT